MSNINADLAALLADPEQIPATAVVGELERLKTSLVGSLAAKLTNGSGLHLSKRDEAKPI